MYVCIYIYIRTKTHSNRKFSFAVFAQEAREVPKAGAKLFCGKKKLDKVPKAVSNTDPKKLIGKMLKISFALVEHVTQRSSEGAQKCCLEPQWPHN